VALCGAATFIELASPASLKVDPDEFIAHMLAAGALSDEQLELMTAAGDAAASAGANEADGAATGQQWHQPGGSSAVQHGLPAQKNRVAQQPAALQSLPMAPLHQTGGDAAGAHAPVALPSVAALEAQGAVLLAARATDGGVALSSQHHYACVSVESLTLGDVPHLLAAYKELLLRHEALLAGLEHHRTQVGATQPQPPHHRDTLQTAALQPAPASTAVTAQQPANEVYQQLELRQHSSSASQQVQPVKLQQTPDTAQLLPYVAPVHVIDETLPAPSPKEGPASASLPPTTAAAAVMEETPSALGSVQSDVDALLGELLQQQPLIEQEQGSHQHHVQQPLESLEVQKQQHAAAGAPQTCAPVQAAGGSAADADDTFLTFTGATIPPAPLQQTVDVPHASLLD
jgi:Rab5 GDP/GTP exchange factor